MEGELYGLRVTVVLTAEIRYRGKGLEKIGYNPEGLKTKFYMLSPDNSTVFM